MITRLAHFSDPHLSPSKPYFRGNFDLVAAHIAAAKPDIVVNTGDLSLDGASDDAALAEADLSAAVAAHKAIPGELLVLPGNHDVGDHPDIAKKEPANAARLARWSRLVGADSWTRDIPGWRLVGLNAQTVGTGLPGDAEQLEMLAGAARNLKGRALALLLHKPLADERYAETLISNRFLTAGPRKAILAACASARPAVVLCGHVHQYRDTRMDGTNHIWSPPTSFIIGDPWQPGFGAKAVGYLMHEFSSDGAHRHNFVPVRGLVLHDIANIPEAYGDLRGLPPGSV
jgi:3',5'-cyclic-AMP phosphodiesterase